MKADLRQDINWGFAFSRCLNRTTQKREDLKLLLFKFSLIYKYLILNGAIPSCKCSIKAPDKWQNKQTLFMSLQRSAIKEVNDWALDFLTITKFYFFYFIFRSPSKKSKFKESKCATKSLLSKFYYFFSKKNFEQ